MLEAHAKALGNVVVLSLQGRIVNGEMDVLRNAVQSLPQASVLKLDLAGVTTIDAAGLGVMLILREQAEARGIRFELMNVTSWVSRVLEVTRLDSVFQITSRRECFKSAARDRQGSMRVLASCA